MEAGWHISLSTWLRDYLYFPLGGSTRDKLKTCRNLMITMLLAGLWHGAAWTYVMFGAIHGVILSVERLLFPTRAAGPGEVASSRGLDGLMSVWGRRILTFHLLCLSLAFFRAESLSAALQFLGGLSNFTWRSEYASAFLMLAVFAVPLFLVDLLLEASDKEYPFAEAPYAIRTGMAVAALVILAVFSGSKLNTFIYFQF